MRLASAVLGAFNGYLVIGSIWYFMDQYEYPLDPLIMMPALGTGSANFIDKLPLVWENQRAWQFEQPLAWRRKPALRSVSVVWPDRSSFGCRRRWVDDDWWGVLPSAWVAPVVQAVSVNVTQWVVVERRVEVHPSLFPDRVSV